MTLFSMKHTLYIFKKYFNLFIHLTALGLSCCTQDLWLPPSGSSALIRIKPRPPALKCGVLATGMHRKSLHLL